MASFIEYLNSEEYQDFLNKQRDKKMLLLLQEQMNLVKKLKKKQKQKE